MASSTIGDCSFNKEECVRKMPCGFRKDIAGDKRPVSGSCSGRVLIACGMPGSETSFTTTGQTINTALVTVDTSCFIKPVVDIRFSSQIDVRLQLDDSIAPPATVEVVLLHELICRADRRGDIVLGSWTYRRSLTGTAAAADNVRHLQTADAFRFNKCLFPEPCQGCINYFVRITAGKISVNSIII